jgi:hypothetical protein
MALPSPRIRWRGTIHYGYVALTDSFHQRRAGAFVITDVYLLFPSAGARHHRFLPVNGQDSRLRSHPQQRAQAWSRIWDEYMLGDDFSGYPEFKARMWQRQLHIYSSPFYYIDYALAETCALQLWLLNRQDHEKALSIYLELCRHGGSKPFLDLVSSAGLTSPFTKGLLKTLLEPVTQAFAL